MAYLFFLKKEVLRREKNNKIKKIEKKFDLIISHRELIGGRYCTFNNKLICTVLYSVKRINEHINKWYTVYLYYYY